MLRKIALNLIIIMAVVATMTASTQAAFTSQATISGITFSTGHAGLNLFGNLGYTNAGNNGNLTYLLPGRGFNDIGPNWQTGYLLKYFNNGTVKLQTSLKVVIQSDQGGLANHIKVATWLWGDLDGNGQESVGDTFEQLAPPQPLQQLVTNPVALGQLIPGNPRGILLRFSTNDLPTETQRQSLGLNFVIDGTTDGVTE